MGGYQAARRQFPYPQHVPKKLAWDNGVKAMKSYALPLIGTLTAFELARGYYETRYPVTKRFELGPMLFATAVAGIPLAASIIMKKPHPMLATGVTLGVYDYAWDRTTMRPYNGNLPGI